MRYIKKIFVIAILTLFICSSMTSVFGEDERNETLVFEYTFSNPQFNKNDIKGELYDKVEIEGLENTYSYGKPCLPVKHIKILLPYGKNLKNIKIQTSEKINLGKGFNIQIADRLVPIIATQQTFEHSKEIESVKKSKIIETDSLYTKVGVYTYRGFSILHINLHPMQYNFETGALAFYDYIKLIIETEDSTANKALRNLPDDYENVKKIVDNPTELSSYKSCSLDRSTSTATYDYLVITNNNFKNSNAQYNLQDLMNYKSSKGLNPYIVTVGEILLNPDYNVNGKWGDNNQNNPFYTHEINGDTSTFNDKAAKIRNYIRYAYTELGTNYVLLVGDADGYSDDDNIIPARGLFADEDGLPLNGLTAYESEDIPSDVYYACLDGNFNYDGDEHFGEAKHFNDENEEIDEADLYAEVWVGRCSADSTQEVSNFVEKTLAYEQTTDPYIEDILFIGEQLGNMFYTNWGGEYKDETEYLIPEQYNLEKMYDLNYQFEEGRDWWPQELFDRLNNNPPNIINHDGHGHVHYGLRFGTDGVAELTNDKYFFIYSHSCLTGSFDNGYDGHYYEEDCLAEYFTVETNHGAYAVIMNARYGLGSQDSIKSPSGIYDESFYKALFTENIKNIGHANHYSKEDHINSIDENGMRWCYYQTNLLGDPELRIKDPAASAPNKPNKPTGPNSGKINTKYSFTTISTDPSGDQLYYLFDWGDGTNSGWIGPFNSGEEAIGEHSWTRQGDFNVKVKAKNSNEVQSEWSDPLSINMPRYKVSFTIFQKLFSYNPTISRLIQYILKL